MNLSRREIDPYSHGGPVVGGRHLGVRLLAERPELDSAVRDSLALQAPCADQSVIPIELRLLALALRERRRIDLAAAQPRGAVGPA